MPTGKRLIIALTLIAVYMLGPLVIQFCKVAWYAWGVALTEPADDVADRVLHSDEKKGPTQ